MIHRSLYCSSKPMVIMVRSLSVAVIGAGFCGLVAARELQNEGHRVVVFEKNDRLGGTWVYDPRVEIDPLGLNPDREIVHSSLYLSLRTNLPRQIMGFLDYPFLKKENGDSRTYPSHEEVLLFLNDFARDFKLVELIRFESEVVRVERVSERKDEWVVESMTLGKELEVEVFEAVVVCNGHNSQPRLAEFAGIDKWPGNQIHSHNYRTPELFQDQTVVLIGSGPSALDISREISKVAKEIHLVSRSSTVKIGRLDNYDNIWQHSMVSVLFHNKFLEWKHKIWKAGLLGNITSFEPILQIECVHEDRKVVFHDGSSVHADVIFHCTGFKYHFPFLETNGIVSVDDNRVGPLYKHVFPPALAPWLSFIGLPNKVLISAIMEFQSKWVAQVLSGKVQLPNEEEMMASVEEFYKQMEESGRPKHYTHSLYLYEVFQEHFP